MAQMETLEVHRPSITGHCYRMLGSAVDADDAVQETMVRAWRNLERFEERSSLRTWLHRIATNVCLDALADRKRRTRPTIDGAQGTIDDALVERERAHWLEPIPDARVVPANLDPAERLALRQSIRLAFVTALQSLPPKQRAALLLTDVVGCTAAEAAETLDTSVASINSALQRARETLGRREERAAPDLTEDQLALVDRYVAAFERYDIDELTSLMHEDATLSMPPYTLWLRGHESIAAWLLGHGIGCRGSRIVRTRACGVPAFAQYRPDPGGGHSAWALIVLEIEGERISEMISFLDVESIFPIFDLPLALPATESRPQANA